MPEQLPLFPLGQPLFPGVTLNLQIFEQRYLHLVRKSMRDDSSFGIIAIRDGKEVGSAPDIFDYGLEVSIIDWRQQENGLLGVAVSGKRRFQVLGTALEDDGLLVGEVDWLHDRQSSFAFPEANLDGLERLLRDLAKHPALSWIDLPEKLSLEELSWKLAQALPISLDKKMLLLEESDPTVRLAKIQDYVDELNDI